MKLIVGIFLAVTCVAAAPEPGVSEWRAEYGGYPTGQVIKLDYNTPYVRYGAPLLRYGGPLLEQGAPIMDTDPSILKLDPSMYYRLASKAYNLPEGYRVSYDPENFNDAFGFYPDYKK